MIRGCSYRKSRAFVCAAAALAFGAACMLRRHTAGGLSARMAQNADREATLRGRMAALGPCDLKDVEELRTKVSGMRSRLGAADTWDRLIRSLGAAWEAGPLERKEKEGYAVCAGTLRLRQPSTSDWAAIIDAVRAIEAVPGASVSGFEMRTSGDRVRRAVDVVSVAVSTETERLPLQPRQP